MFMTRHKRTKTPPKTVPDCTPQPTTVNDLSGLFTVRLEMECNDCEGTGLRWETPGDHSLDTEHEFAYICCTCEGTGRRTLPYRPYLGRRPSPKVLKYVRSAPRLLCDDYTTLSMATFQRQCPAPAYRSSIGYH